MTSELIPVPNAQTAPYWDATRTHKLMLPYCTGCKRYHFYPRSQCPFCASVQIEWREVSGEGTVYSFTIVHRAPSQAFAAEVPYVVAVVKLSEGPHLMTRIVDCPPESIRIDDLVRVAFRDVGGQSLPVFVRRLP